MLVRSGFANIYTDLCGSGGTPALLLHGMGGSHESWTEVSQRLARTRLVLAMDLRGCGRSERGSEAYSLALLADDAVALLEQARVPRCHLVGHSLGGAVAQELLVRYGDRFLSAALVSTSSRVGPQATQAWLRLAQSVEAHGLSDSPSARARAFSEAFARERPEAVAHHARLAAACDPSVYAAQARAASSYNYDDALAAVHQRVLVTQGLEDRLTPPAGSVLLSRALKRSELELLEGVGHNLPAELGTRFAERLERLFASAETEPG